MFELIQNIFLVLQSIKSIAVMDWATNKRYKEEVVIMY